MHPSLRRASIPLAIYLIATLIYLLVSWDRLAAPTQNNHFVYLASAWLDGRLDLGPNPPGTNDWACFDEETRARCAADRSSSSRAHSEGSRRYYVSFPPFPAVLALPAVALFGLDLRDALFFGLLAGIAPALIYLVLRRLRESGESGRTERDDLLLVALFAFGSVYFFSAVQGTVWFAAHIVACALMGVYLLAAMDGRRPLLAGLAIGCLLATRPSALLLSFFFAIEALRPALRDREGALNERPTPREFLLAALSAGTLRRYALFSLPILAIGALLALHNYARFGDPSEYGHRFLMIRWIHRIEEWGLFSYHYLARNLTAHFTSLPWFGDAPPYLTISRHGLALWIVSPALLYLFYPARMSLRLFALLAAIVPVFALDLLYQNTGWVQFGPRFILDWLPLGIVALALMGRRFGRLFTGLVLLSILVSSFGAITFDRHPAFYDDDLTQERFFQPH